MPCRTHHLTGAARHHLFKKMDGGLQYFSLFTNFAPLLKKNVNNDGI